MNDEIAFSFIWFVQILLWGDLKDIVTHLESNWLHFLGDILAWGLNMAECLITFAIQFWEASCPLLSDLFENIWRYRELGASSVYYGGIAGVLPWLLHGLGSIGHSLSFESPCTKPIREVLESLEAICSVHYLWGVVSAKESVWRLVHLLGGHAETDHGVVNDTVVLKGPEVMQLLLAHVFVRRQS